MNAILNTCFSPSSSFSILACYDTSVFIEVHTGFGSQFTLLFLKDFLVVEVPVLCIDSDTCEGEIDDSLNGQRNHLVVGCAQVTTCSIEVYESLASESRRENV